MKIRWFHLVYPLGLIACALVAAPHASACPLVGVVRHVTSGELVTVETDRGRLRVRLDGIAVPQTPASLAQQAKSSLGRLVLNQQVAVHCVSELDTDPVLGLVRKGSVDVAELLLAQGRVKTGRNAKQYPRYKHLEFEARKARRGLWAYESPERTVCTLDVRQCTDGTYVGRQPPSCEFSLCPDGTQLK